MRVLLSVGGGGRSAHFPAVAGDKAKRARLARALAALVEAHELDGVDLDWEAPRTEDEMTDYVRLLKAVRRRLHPSSAGGGGAPRRKLVTVAVHPGQRLPPAAVKAVDRVHLMAYDMQTTAHLTAQQQRAVGGSQGHATASGAEAAARQQLGFGVPASKLVLGIPAYGRHLVT